MPWPIVATTIHPICPITHRSKKASRRPKKTLNRHQVASKTRMPWNNPHLCTSKCHKAAGLSQTLSSWCQSAMSSSRECLQKTKNLGMTSHQKAVAISNQWMTPFSGSQRSIVMTRMVYSKKSRMLSRIKKDSLNLNKVIWTSWKLIRMEFIFRLWWIPISRIWMM